jgi:hypothetical protein
VSFGKWKKLRTGKWKGEIGKWEQQGRRIDNGSGANRHLVWRKFEARIRAMRMNEHHGAAPGG